MSLLGCKSNNLRVGNDHDGNGNTTDNQNPSSEFITGKNIQIAGIRELQNVYLSFTDSKDEIIGLLSTNYNKSINLDSLKMKEGQEYYVKAYSEGYEVSAPKKLIVSQDQAEVLATFSFEKISDDLYRYHWENDFKNKEYEYSSKVPRIEQVQFLGEEVQLQNLSSTVTLKDKFNILLSDEQEVWSLDYSTKLLKTLVSIPHEKLDNIKLVLTNENIADDILIRTINSKKVVTLSKASFSLAGARMVRLDGVRGKYFSKRLHHALTRLITNNGSDKAAVEKILKDTYDVELEVSDIKTLTGEDQNNFQEFHSSELIDILSAFAEMPSGFNKISGLKYLLRRKNGQPHPTHPSAPAVAWPRGADTDSYIEFMESAFRNTGGGILGTMASDEYLHRLIIHEKTHFIYDNLLSEKVLTNWIDTAGWVKNPADPDGWINTSNTAFVSPYAHLKNPAEDFSESISYYVLNPNKLKSTAPLKYEFILKKIMNGAKYIAEVREDLKFEVLNLFPDYDYPGKIQSVDVKAIGGKLENKEVEIEINLLNKAGFNDGAQKASMRITSSIGTYLDVNLSPVNGNNHKLKGALSIPANAKAGYWLTDQIVIEDSVGNLRMEGIDDFGFSLYINNQVEDIVAPEYIPGSLTIKVSPETLQGKAVHKVTVQWELREDVLAKSKNGAYISFNSLDHEGTYSINKHGDIDTTNNKAKVSFYLTNYFPSGRYSVSFLRMADVALNYGTQNFSADPSHEPEVIVNIQTNDHDTVSPDLDLNRISINAVPTNLSNPDGQTKVTISYFAKDDKSGVGAVSYALIDPTGKRHSEYHYHENFYTDFFNGVANRYNEYRIEHVLPRGSAPGIWGLQEIVLNDKGGNSANFNFTEIIHFEVEDK